MTYVCAVVGAIGLFVILAGRYKVKPEPVCPNCRRCLANFEVERCPHCLLWMPPGLDRMRVKWRKPQVAAGMLVFLFAVFIHSMWRAGIFELMASTQTTTIPASTPATPSPNSTTPATINQLQSLGYVTTSAPATQSAPASNSTSGNTSTATGVPPANTP